MDANILLHIQPSSRTIHHKAVLEMLFANTEQGLVLIKDVIRDMLTGSHLCTVYWLLLSCHFELCLNISPLLKEPTTSKQKVSMIREKLQKNYSDKEFQKTFLCTITYIQLRNRVAALNRKSSMCLFSFPTSSYPSSEISPSSHGLEVWISVWWIIPVFIFYPTVAVCATREGLKSSGTFGIAVWILQRPCCRKSPWHFLIILDMIFFFFFLI